METDKILVLGATGNVGGHLLAILVNEGIKVRAGYYSGESLPSKLHQNHHLVDYAKPETLIAATKGIDQIFVVIPDTPVMDQFARNIVTACSVNQVKHFVLISGAGVTASPNNLVSKRLQAMEMLFSESGMSGIILRSVFFMQNYINQFPPTPDGKLILPMGQGRVSYIDVRDVAKASFCALRDWVEGPANQVIVNYLTGDKSYTVTQVANMFNGVIELPYEYIDAPVAEVILQLRSKGVPDWKIEMLQEIYHSAQNHRYDLFTKDFTHLTSQNQTSFEAFLKDYKVHFISNYHQNTLTNE